METLHEVSMVNPYSIECIKVTLATIHGRAPYSFTPGLNSLYPLALDPGLDEPSKAR
jgi:hypothetical protein